MVHCALFDLDGTLTDPEEGITRCVAYALAHFGIEVSELRSLRKFIGPPLKDSFMEFYGLSEPDALAAIDKYRERFSAIGIFENRLYPGIESVLSQLCGDGLTLAVASSKPEVYVKQILEHFNLSRFFTAVCGSELDGRRTDKAEVISYALAALSSPPAADCVMVGDRMHDIIGARKNSLRSVGVLYGFGSRVELLQAGADRLAEAVSDVYDAISVMGNLGLRGRGESST